VFPSWRPADGGGEYGRIGTPRVNVVNSIAAFPVVPLLQEFRLDAGGGGEYRSGQAIARGPARAGETVDVDLLLGPRLATITGVLVGEDGAPLTDVSVSMALFTLPRGAPEDAELEKPPWLWVPLDGEGRFEKSTDLEPDATQRVVLLVQEESRHTPSEVDRFARWDGTIELAPGALVDLGTLVLRPHSARRLLAAGSVVAADGGPLKYPGIDVGFWDRRTQQWTRLTEDQVEVARDGSFEAWTILAKVPERFTVSASARGYLGASVEASLGERGLQLVLARGGGLAGRFVTSDPAALPMLSVLIEGQGFEREPDIALGNFRVDNLPPGTYSVVAKGHGTDWRFGAVLDVVVPEGGFADDPRLQRIDLGDACRVLHLTVLDPEARPIAEHYVDIADPAGDGGNFRTNEVGELVALVPAAAQELGLSVTWYERRLAALWSPASGARGTITLVEQNR
jgi:hypothetical protein